MRIPFSQWRHSGPVRRGLYYAMIEGAVVGGLFVCLEAWLVPLMQDRLQAAAYVIGLLTLIPQIGFILLSPFTGAMIRRMGGNKAASLTVVWWQIALVAGLSIPLHGAGQPWAIPLAVVMISAFGLTGVIGGPAWIGWVSGFVPRQISGSYQARRMRLFNITKLGFAALFAGIAHLLPIAQSPWGLQLIIAIAALSRLASWWCLQRQPVVERPVSRQPLSKRSAEAATGLRDFVHTLHSTDFGRWTLVWATFQGGVMVAGPFFASYMIASPQQGGLGLEPFSYSLLLYVSVVSRILFYPLAGHMVDVFGPRSVMRLAFIGIFLLPITWAATASLPILLLNEVLAGLAWACAEISIGGLLFSSHPDPLRRTELVGWFNTISASFMGLGTLLGTVLIDVVPPIAGSRYHTIFLLSMALRVPGLILALRWLPGLRAMRPEEGQHLMQTLPGVELVSAFGRGLANIFRRPLD